MTGAASGIGAGKSSHGLLRAWCRQRWIPFGIRDRALRALVSPGGMAPTPFECEFAGMRYRGDLASYIDWTIYFYGAYEPGLLAFLRDCAATTGPGSVFVDIGANTGQHALFMASRVDQVHAFEPWPEALDRLEKNISLNALSNVTVHQFGLGEENGTVSFHSPASSNLGTGSFRADVNATPSVGVLSVRRGDDVFAASGLDRMDIVKIDVEGFELKVLSGLRETLARFRPVIVLELLPVVVREQGSADRMASTIADILGAGWRLLRLTGVESYRVEDFAHDGNEVVTAVLVPDRLAAVLPRSGRW